MNKAYRIHWAVTQKTLGIELKPKWGVPRVKCSVCGSIWGQGLIYHPAVDCDFFKEDIFNFDRVVDLQTFRKLEERICRSINFGVKLVPGASLGVQAIEVKRKDLDDLIWGTITVPQISRRAHQILKEEGIELFTVECPTMFRGRDIGTHLAIQINLHEVLTESGMELLELSQCEACGRYSEPCKEPKLAPWKVDEVRKQENYVRRDIWSKGEHLIMSAETLNVIASRELMDAVQKHRLTGIQFWEYGHYE